MTDYPKDLSDYVPTESDRARFWSKVDTSGDCWMWLAGKIHSGYGHFRLPFKTVSAHRFSYLLEHGELPRDKYMDHICRTRACVRPDHLRLVTPKQNAENKSPRGQGGKAGMRGVTYLKAIDQWQARVGHQGKIHYAGTFKTKEEAARAAADLRRKLFTHSIENA